MMPTPCFKAFFSFFFLFLFIFAPTPLLRGHFSKAHSSREVFYLFIFIFISTLTPHLEGFFFFSGILWWHCLPLLSRGVFFYIDPVPYFPSPIHPPNNNTAHPSFWGVGFFGRSDALPPILPSCHNNAHPSFRGVFFFLDMQLLPSTHPPWHCPPLILRGGFFLLIQHPPPIHPSYLNNAHPSFQGVAFFYRSGTLLPSIHPTLTMPTPHLKGWVFL